MLEAQASAARAMPPRPNLALSDIDLESSRDTSSVDSHSVVDAAHGAGYFNHHRVKSRGPPFLHIPHGVRLPSQYPHQEPWSPECRRNSLPDDRAYPSSWPSDGPTPTTYGPPPPPNSNPHHHRPHLHHHHHHHHHHNVRPQHTRIPSDISITSSDTSDTSSITTSSASMSPAQYHAQLHSSPSGPSSSRRHSTSLPPQRPAQGYPPNERQPCSPPPSKPKNVHWQDMDDVFDSPRFNLPRNRSMDLRGRGDDSKNDYRVEDQRRGARSVGPMTGVGGRRYAPTSGTTMAWR